MSQPYITQPEGIFETEKQDVITKNAIAIGVNRSSSTLTATGSQSASADHIDEDTAPSPPEDVEPPPDGGLRAWLQVAAGHLAVFNSWGIMNSFGIFQGTYVSYLHESPSAISWIGSIEVFLLLFVGTLSGRALDGGYYRYILCVGTALQLVSIFSTSAAREGAYWQVMLAQGVCQGLGFGCFFAPSIAVVSTYFSTRRTIAIQCVACGGAVGGIVFPLIAQHLLPRVGFAWTLRAMGFVVLFNSIFIISVMRPRLPPRRSGPLIDFAAFRELPYLLYCIGSFFILWGAYTPYYYGRVYATDILGVEATTSFNVLLVLNSMGVPGRIVPGLVADRWTPRSPLYVYVPCSFLAAIVTYVWSTARDLNHYWVWIVMFGFFGASIQGLFTATIPSLSPHPSKNGTRIGMCFTIVSLAALTGPPLAGQIIQSSNGRYLPMTLWAGTTMLMGTGFAAASAVAFHRGPSGRVTEKQG